MLQSTKKKSKRRARFEGTSAYNPVVKTSSRNVMKTYNGVFNYGEFVNNKRIEYENQARMNNLLTILTTEHAIKTQRDNNTLDLGTLMTLAAQNKDDMRKLQEQIAANQNLTNDNIYNLYQGTQGAFEANFDGLVNVMTQHKNDTDRLIIEAQKQINNVQNGLDLQNYRIIEKKGRGNRYVDDPNYQVLEDRERERLGLPPRMVGRSTDQTPQRAAEMQQQAEAAAKGGGFSDWLFSNNPPPTPDKAPVPSMIPALQNTPQPAALPPSIPQVTGEIGFASP